VEYSCYEKTSSFSAGQEILRIVVEPEVSPPCSQQLATCRFAEPEQSNKRSSHLRVPIASVVLPSDFDTKHYIHFSFPLQTCHMSCSSQPPWCNHPNNTQWEIQIMELLTVQRSQPHWYILSLRLNLHRVPQHPLPMLFP